jgi:signal transduction histidine kinase
LFEVAVRDRGPGLSADDAEHIFELFYRAGEARRTAAGAGIGLYVVRALVEAMGGRVWARNRADGGAEIGFTLLPFVEGPPSG